MQEHEPKLSISNPLEKVDVEQLDFSLLGLNLDKRVVKFHNQGKDLIDFLSQQQKLDYGRAKGLICEWIVKNARDQQPYYKEKTDLLTKWSNTIVNSNRNHEGRAANIPDWLNITIDKHTKLTKVIDVVEVKASPSDLPTIQQDKKAAIASWSGIQDLEDSLSDYEKTEWQKRMDQAWVSSGKRFYSQARKHLRRLREIADVLDVDVSNIASITIYVPEGEDYSDIPESYSEEAPENIMIRRLPSLDNIDKFIAQLGIKKPEEKGQIGKSYSKVVEERQKGISEDLGELQKNFQLNTPSLEQFLTDFLIGADGFSIESTGERSITGTNRLLSKLRIVAPSLTAQVLFEMNGKLPQVSQAIKNKFKDCFGKDVDGSLERLLGTLTKLKTSMSEKGITSADLDKNIDYAVVNYLGKYNDKVMAEYADKSLLTKDEQKYFNDLLSKDYHRNWIDDGSEGGQQCIEQIIEQAQNDNPDFNNIIADKNFINFYRAIYETFTDAGKSTMLEVIDNIIFTAIKAARIKYKEDWNQDREQQMRQTLVDIFKVKI